MEIGGLPLVRLQIDDSGSGSLRFLHADILPGRGMMLLQARAFLPGYGEIDVLAAPPPVEAAQQLGGGPEDFAGNRSFAFGGALLLPFANRIQGRPLPDRRIAADLAGQPATLPANWGGKAEGAAAYAMHGLMLDVPVKAFRRVGASRLEADWPAGDFGGAWPSRAKVAIAWTLAAHALRLEIKVVNVGDEILPLGIGWHPYFRLPSGARRQARLRLPARARLEVGDYDQVLPTGRVLPAAGAYDFQGLGGAALGELYLDDCFVDLVRENGSLSVDVADPAAGYGLRLSTASTSVKAVQVYAPPDEPFIVVEPQFNWADPFSSIWDPSLDTGMARLAPGQATDYEVMVQLIGIAAG